MISIVIPAYNHYGLTHQLLLDIYKWMPDVEVVVADDCSTDQVVHSGLLWWKNSMLKDRMKIVDHLENVGFLRNANSGVAIASGDVVILCNNDVRIYENPVDKILETFSNNPDIPILVGARLLSGDTGWNTFGSRIFSYLEGWFLGFRKSEWNKFGGFDERYAPFDIDDLDLSTTYLARGGKLVEVELNVVHTGAQSIYYSPEREAQTKINQKKFEEKWCKDV